MKILQDSVVTQTVLRWANYICFRC